MRHIHIVVAGRVQGVGFRAFTQQVAVENDIVGWVRNHKNGSVEIEAAGNDLQIDQFLEKVKKGPSFFAKVKNIEITEVDSEKDYRNFEIKY